MYSAPDWFPLLVIQEVHLYYRSGVRAVNVLCNVEYQFWCYTTLCAINIYYIQSVIHVEVREYWDFPIHIIIFPFE